MNYIQNQLAISAVNSSAEDIEQHSSKHLISEQLGQLASECFPPFSRLKLNSGFLHLSIDLDSTHHKELLDLTKELDNHMKVPVRYDRGGIDEFFQGLLAYTIGIDDTQLLNFKLLWNPRVILGLIEGVTWGVKVIEYNLERISSFAGVQNLDKSALDNISSEWLAVVSDPLSWATSSDMFMIELIHIDQLKKVASCSDFPLEHDSYFEMCVSRHARLLEDRRRADINSLPDVYCVVKPMESDRRQAEWRAQLSEGKLLAIPLDSKLIQPLIESTVSKYVTDSK